VEVGDGGVMNRTLALALSVCVALVAAPAVGTTPSVAQSGCRCHTGVPPANGAAAAHAPFVLGVADCTACHRGMTAPHPAVVEPRLDLGASPSTGRDGRPRVSLGGRLFKPGGLGLNQVVVYLQQRVPGSSTFVDVQAVTTHRVKRIPLAPGYDHPDGWFNGQVASPIWGATYRAVTQGVRGTTVVKPARAKTILYPGFGVWLSGPDRHGDLTFGQSVVASGSGFPAELLAGETVKLTLLQGYHARIVGEATIGADGTYSWTVTPKARGKRYRVEAELPGTAEHYGVLRRTANFRVN
jgi:hypothetical protein